MPKPPRKTAARKGGRARVAKSDGVKSSTARRAATAKRSKPKKRERTLIEVVTKALEDLKALDAVFLDVRHLTTVTDTMVIASGRSDRHLRAIANAVVEQCKAAGFRPLGVEGEGAGEWVLVDLGDVVVHVMLPRVREFYNLERLWNMSARDDSLDRGANA